MRLLITGSRSYTALEMARHFNRAGCDVYVADCVKYPVCKGSNTVTQSFILPSPRENYRGFIDGLIQIIQQYRIDLLMPSSEEIFFIAGSLDKLRKYCRVFCDPFEKLNRLHNKWEFSRLTGSCRVKTPATILLQSPEDLKPFEGSAEKYVFKPVYGRFAARNLFGPDPSQIRQIQPGPHDPWLAQEYIQGGEYCSYHLAMDGEIKAHACYRPAYRMGRASGYYFHPVEHEEIAQFAAEIAQKLQFTGHLAFDFIETPAGSLYVLECNPRTTSGLHFLSQEELVSPFLPGEQAVPRRHAMEKPKMIGYAMMLNPFYHGVTGIRRWARDFGNADDVLFDRRDQRVLIYHFLSLLETLYVSFSKRISVKDAATSNIEWDGEKI
ncbi:ATP-grasp domain-containing protein [Paenactinomyces guangxiensis]|uniref:ATP-grasp domain-containing protein n=1 Tax=Paenactinomyces guangxiensis TaxID=1490290 RepID=A0A7W2A821_9BACL|nr:ATP-grasp domain-containing protein [Paenactinomyces guangxiensis]MBA4493368.1 ATP-grasp domain-containing protein [Paenactinomyces guangxiensis]MBH8590458.1 ATP-grasp domain-containing protein [Paenactinomyces guangxiensis]